MNKLIQFAHLFGQLTEVELNSPTIQWVLGLPTSFQRAQDGKGKNIGAVTPSDRRSKLTSLLIKKKSC
jgi:hypothetical protein